jgi:hypothetical protein
MRDDGTIYVGTRSAAETAIESLAVSRGWKIVDAAHIARLAVLVTIPRPHVPFVMLDWAIWQAGEVLRCAGLSDKEMRICATPLPGAKQWHIAIEIADLGPMAKDP